MGKEKLSDELKRCLDGSGCKTCQYWEDKITHTCAGLLEKAYERIKGYDDMFPCEVGDTVYRIHKGTELSPTRVYECRVVAIMKKYGNILIKLRANINEETYSIWVDDWFGKCQIGSEFFLTREQAESELKKNEEAEE